MTISQKRAIIYKINQIKRQKQAEYIRDNGLSDDWCKSHYKTMTWYLKSKGVHIAV